MARKSLTGKVVSLKLPQTAVVSVESVKMHPRYKKRFKSHKKYLVHIGESKLEMDQIVMIEEGRPMSKSKMWYLLNK